MSEETKRNRKGERDSERNRGRGKREAKRREEDGVTLKKEKATKIE